jgi:hypothetical protein
MGLAARLQGPGDEIAQLGILTRHFFTRLFRNDIVDFEDQMKARLIAVLSILAVIMGWSSQLLVFFKYEFSPDAGISWQDKNYIFMLEMLIFGIVTLLEWEMLFPDRRDFVNLTPLPVRLRTVFAAKLASFVAFIGLFSVAMNSLSSVVFTMFLAQWRSNSLLFGLRYLAAHLISAFAACFCVFFACMSVNLFLAAVLPFALYRRSLVLVRFILIALFVFLLVSFLTNPGGVSGIIRSLPRLKDHGSPLLLLVPSLWFAGLYEVLLGKADPVFIVLAKRAGLALGLSVGAFGLACILSYVNYLRRTLESSNKRGRLRSWRAYGAGLVQGAILRTPEERAVGTFFSKTIRSSPKHRTVLFNGLALGAAVAMLSIVASRQDIRALSPSNPLFLAQSILMVFVLLGAIRIVVDIPAALESNWVFQVTETGERRRYVSGLKTAAFFQWLLPLSVLLFAAHLWLWRAAGAAALHAAFCLALSGLGLEALFFHYRKIPFASSHVPGKLQLQVRGVPYLVGLIGLLAGSADLEKALLGYRPAFWAFFPAAGLVWHVLRTVNARYLETHPLIYEEEPEPAMIGFPDAG